MFFPSFKVSILDIAQFIGWLPVNAAIIVSFCGRDVPDWVADVLITAVIPINSVINPILDTKLLKEVWYLMKRFVIKVRNLKC